MTLSSASLMFSRYLFLLHVACVCGLKIFVAQLPSDKSAASYTKYWDDLNKLDDAGIKHAKDKLLGEVLSEPDSLYYSWWQSLDLWWVIQMKTSPLRVMSPEEADMIFIPIIINTDYYYIAQSHIKTLNESQFPYLHTKPHVIVINNPPSLQTNWNLFNTPNKHLFWLITLSADDSADNHIHGTHKPNNNMPFTIAPYFWRQHWTNKSIEMNEQWNDELQQKIKNNKKYLTSASWKDRVNPHKHPKVHEKWHEFYKGREIYEQQCRASNENDCKWVNFEFNHTVIKETKKITEQSWYSLQAIGTFFVIYIDGAST